jgi:hypothetical protein
MIMRFGIFFCAGVMLLSTPAWAEPTRLHCVSESRNPTGQVVRDEITIDFDPALEHADVTYLYAPAWEANPQPERYSAEVALSPTRAVFTLRGRGVASGQSLIVDRRALTVETPGLARRSWAPCRTQQIETTGNRF